MVSIQPEASPTRRAPLRLRRTCNEVEMELATAMAAAQHIVAAQTRHWRRGSQGFVSFLPLHPDPFFILYYGPRFRVCWLQLTLHWLLSLGAAVYDPQHDELLVTS